MGNTWLFLTKKTFKNNSIPQNIREYTETDPLGLIDCCHS